MRYAIKFLCCALCATMPLAHAATPPSASTSGAPIAKVAPAKVKAKAKTKAKKTIKHSVKKKRVPQASAAKRKPVIAQPAPAVLTIAAVPLAPTTPVAPSAPLGPVAAIPPQNVVRISVPEPMRAPVLAMAPARNPYLPEQYASAGPNPYLAGPVTVSKMPLAENPYAAKTSASSQVAATVPAPTPALAQDRKEGQATAPLAIPVPTWPSAQGANPYASAQIEPPATTSQATSSASVGSLAPRVEQAPTPWSSGRDMMPSALAKLDPLQDLSGLFNSVRNGIPVLNGQDLLPTIKKVYPTGEKPLVILSFKCPTEMLGVTPPPMKALHELVNFAFDGINKTNLLSFNMQQVCQ